LASFPFLQTEKPGQQEISCVLASSIPLTLPTAL
jgi:hypothetical protein